MSPVFTTSKQYLVGINIITQYQGPGDVLPGATGAWLLRAYSAATRGTNAIRLRRDSDNSESDFATLINGSLDIASIATFKGTANLFITKRYDQSGYGNDEAQVTAANQPAFLLNTIGSQPGGQYLNATSQFMVIGGTFTLSSVSPFTILSVIKTTSFPGYNGMFGSSVTNTGFAIDTTQTTGIIRFTQMSVGTIGLSTAAPSANSWATIAASYDGTNWAMYLNGAASGSGANAVSVAAHQHGSGLNDSSPYFMDGFINETLAYGSVVSAANNAALYNNQQTFWNF
jgi:hypothetical protein